VDVPGVLYFFHNVDYQQRFRILFSNNEN